MTKEEILDEFRDFTDGVRVLMLTSRSKDGGVSTGTNRKAKKFVTTNPEEFAEALEILLGLQTEGYRIYSTVNSRNMELAIRRFKEVQLEADYYDESSRHSFYFDIKNRWISSLMKRSSKVESNFLIDIDENEGDSYRNIRAKIDEQTKILFDYPTKNGRHLVTKPFNPNLVQGVEINSDGMLLLSY